MKARGAKKIRKLLGASLAALLLPVLQPRCLPAAYHEAPEDIKKILYPRLLDRQCSLAYIEADSETGWRGLDVTDRASLALAAEGVLKKNGLVIPVLPTVFCPVFPEDKVYYERILGDGGIKKGDKVLVVGCGSGADAWLAWLKSGSAVYVLDINPLAVLNTRYLAAIAGFPVHSLTGDVNSVKWPEGFSDFDYLLWNMPFMTPHDKSNNMEEKKFHDSDAGALLDKFVKTLPKLLRPGGKAIIFNTWAAAERMKKKGLEVKADGTDSPELCLISFEKADKKRASAVSER